MNLERSIGLYEFKCYNFWRACFGETFATFFLIFIGCGSSIPENVGESTDYSNTLRTNMSFPFLVAALVWTFNDISGAHFNPSVTIAFWLTRRITFVRCFVYILCQMLGCTAGSFFYKYYANKRGLVVGLTLIAEDVSKTKAIFIEIIITFTLMIVVYAVNDEGRRDLFGPALVPLIISFVILTLGLFAGPLTGASLNPARSFGPALAMNVWKDQWVYWVGPTIGGILGAFVYEFILSSNASFQKIYNFIMDNNYEPYKNNHVGKSNVLKKSVYHIAGNVGAGKNELECVYYRNKRPSIIVTHLTKNETKMHS